MKIDLTEVQTYYINLPHHVEKNKKMCEMLNDLTFKKFERLDGFVYPNNPVAGCSRAHYHALDPDRVPFILFEDDVYLLENGWKGNIIEVPDDADAVYLGTSTWGRMNGHNGEYVQYDVLKDYPGLLRVYNMLATHAILYISKEYASIIKRAAYHTGYVIENYNDVAFAEIQRYFNIYSFDSPIFAQSSNELGTTHKLTSFPMTQCMNYSHLQFYPYAIR